MGLDAFIDFTVCYSYFSINRRPSYIIESFLQYRTMGSNQSEILKAKTMDYDKQNKAPQRTNTIRNTIGPNKIKFSKVLPKAIEHFEDDFAQEERESFQKDCTKQIKKQPEEQEQQQEQAELPEEGIIEEIKIKWNSFIKMKKKNYLNQYIVIKEIGRGGFGTVSKVKAKYTGVFRAAKKIKKSALAKGEHQKLFAQMAIMITLDHPNIARLFEVYDYKSSYVLILELCEGGQLFKKIVTHKINESLAATIMIQILQALMYLHSKGIVHRDLKPENMLFQKGTTNLKLIDFGIAIKTEKKEVLTTRIGTPYYIAPEVLLKQYGQKCDIWSAGVIMYMMIVFRPPFNGDNEAEILENVIKEEVSFKGQSFKNLSADGLHFLKKILNKNPELRLSAFEAYRHPWIKRHLQINKSSNGTIVKNISNFKFANRLQAVVYTYIVSQILTSQEKSSIKTVFEQLDHNHDGVICVQELKQALLTHTAFSEERINFLMRIIDTNGSGVIDFTEFIVAALDVNSLTEQHFEQAFSYFDTDHSGAIDYDQIAFFLQNKEQSHEEIKKIFQQIDENEDNEVSRQQFLRVLCKKSKQKVQRERKLMMKKNTLIVKDTTK